MKISFPSVEAMYASQTASDWTKELQKPLEPSGCTAEIRRNGIII